MALCNRLYRSQNCILKTFCSSHSPKIVKNVHNSNAQRNEIDVIDVFTTNLLRKKSHKWQNIRIKKLISENQPMVPANTLNNNIKNNTIPLVDNNYEYDKEKLSELIDETIEQCDFRKAKFLTVQCVENKICPSAAVLQKMLSYYAQTGDKDTIILLQKFVEEVAPDIYDFNAKFLHYLAEATWVRGNVSESLKLFDEVYANYACLRRKVRLMLKYFVANVMTDQSEASLVLLVRFTEKLVHKYGDYFPLASVWQACFLSEWYSDQCKAAQILANHPHLFGQIERRIPYIVNTSFKHHQPETVQRLLETLLKYNKRIHYPFVLHSLFNYKYNQNDLRSCAEIMQWSVHIDIPLSSAQHKQFISLLLKQNTRPKREFKKPEAPQKFELKF